jgi:hypothetical protein
MEVSADTVTNQDLENGDFSGVLGLACELVCYVDITVLML